MQHRNAFDELLIGRSPDFCSLLRAAQVVAPTDVTALVLGESGTGKELLATALHRESRRASGPFVAINCAALPEGLAESELFGHRKGAFTGAVKDHCGRIRAAHGGTLFLDEVGELPLTVQAKLLRFLESGEIQGIGETALERVNVRIIAATHHDLYRRVKQGQFRADLFYRLNVVPLIMPPLRERSEDITQLLERLTTRVAQQHGLDVPHFRPRALRALEQYRWPGNIRELQNVIERAVILSPGSHLQVPLSDFKTQVAKVASAVEPLVSVEREHIVRAIREARGVIGGPLGAAARLGMKRTTLQARMRKLGISRGVAIEGANRAF